MMSVATRSAPPVARADAGQERPVTRKRTRPNLWALLIVPNLLFLLVAYAYPIFDILRQSVTDFVPPQQSGLDDLPSGSSKHRPT